MTRLLVKTNYLSALFKLASGSVGAQLVGVLTLPLVMMYLSPSVFGVYSAALAGGTIIAPLCTLGLDRAVPRVEAQLRWMYFVGLLKLVCLCSFALLIAFYFVSLALPHGLSSYFYFGAIVLALGLSIQNATAFLMVSEERFSLDAIAKLAQALIFTLSLLAVGILALAPIYAILADLFSRVLVSFSCFAYAKPRSKLADRPLYYSTLFSGRMDYVKFGFFSMFLVNLGIGLPVFLLPVLYDAESAGIYAIAYKIVCLPSALIGTVIGRLYFVEAGKILDRKQSLQKLFVRHFWFLSALSVVGFASLRLALPYAATFLPYEWRQAEDVIKAIIPIGAVQLVVVPILMTMVVCERQKMELLFNVLRLALVLGVALIVMPFELSFDLFLALVTTAIVFVYVCQFIYCYVLVRETIA